MSESKEATHTLKLKNNTSNRSDSTKTTLPSDTTHLQHLESSATNVSDTTFPDTSLKRSKDTNRYVVLISLFFFVLLFVLGLLAHVYPSLIWATLPVAIVFMILVGWRGIGNIRDCARNGKIAAFIYYCIFSLAACYSTLFLIWETYASAGLSGWGRLFNVWLPKTGFSTLFIVFQGALGFAMAGLCVGVLLVFLWRAYISENNAYHNQRNGVLGTIQKILRSCAKFLLGNTWWFQSNPKKTAGLRFCFTLLLIAGLFLLDKVPAVCFAAWLMWIVVNIDAFFREDEVSSIRRGVRFIGSSALFMASIVLCNSLFVQSTFLPKIAWPTAPLAIGLGVCILLILVIEQACGENPIDEEVAAHRIQQVNKQNITLADELLTAINNLTPTKKALMMVLYHSIVRSVSDGNPNPDTIIDTIHDSSPCQNDIKKYRSSSQQIYKNALSLCSNIKKKNMTITQTCTKIMTLAEESRLAIGQLIYDLMDVLDSYRDDMDNTETANLIDTNNSNDINFAKEYLQIYTSPQKTSLLHPTNPNSSWNPKNNMPSNPANLTVIIPTPKSNENENLTP